VISQQITTLGGF